MRLNETNSKVLTCKHFSLMFLFRMVWNKGILYHCCSSTLCYNTVRNAQETVGLKLKGTHLPMVSADDVNLLAKTIHNIKKKTEVPLDATEEAGVK